MRLRMCPFVSFRELRIKRPRKSDIDIIHVDIHGQFCKKYILVRAVVKIAVDNVEIWRVRYQFPRINVVIAGSHNELHNWFLRCQRQFFIICWMHLFDMI